MNYLSLFSGIGGFEIGIHKIFPDAKCLGYSEIDPSAIKVYESHFPDHKNLGDITQITSEILEPLKGKVDLLVGGSPCQNFSRAGDGKGLDGEKSKLLLEYVRILNFLKPRFFILENVFMAWKHAKQVSDLLKVTPSLCESRLTSFQSRTRLVWCNFPIHNIYSFPNKAGTIGEILLDEDSSEAKSMIHKTLNESSSGSIEKRLYSILIGEPLPQSCWIKLIDRTHRRIRTLNRTDAHYEWVHISGTTVRQIHPIERERLQNFPDNWTAILPKTRRYQVLGNAVTCGVMELIMRELKSVITSSS